MLMRQTLLFFHELTGKTIAFVKVKVLLLPSFFFRNIISIFFLITFISDSQQKKSNNNNKYNSEKSKSYHSESRRQITDRFRVRAISRDFG